MTAMISDEELFQAAENIADGWYPEGRIDWDDFLYRLEEQTDIDLGTAADAPLIRRIKAHIRKYRKQ